MVVKALTPAFCSWGRGGRGGGVAPALLRLLFDHQLWLLLQSQAVQAPTVYREALQTATGQLFSSATLVRKHGHDKNGRRLMLCI